ncbi:hypothetical protein [Sorangium sp. So ce1389]|uniref:hypothetical protein n=1 Tax=Sorangium sp. So ce1389 TaxID=3133336 RepID=UPI003F5DCBD3
MRHALRPSRWINTEFAVAIHPEPQRSVDAGWRRRIRAFAGRSVSHLALEMEQDERGGRLALRGQMVSPGVVQGLEVDAELREGASLLRLSPGTGVAASGEDVTLRAEVVASVDELLVWGTRAPGVAGSADLSLGELRNAGGAPPALVLVLQPAEILAREGGDPEDPCEVDQAADAFADHQRIDAALPLLVRLPEDLDTATRAAPPGTRRNRLAHAIFEAEAAAGRRADVQRGAALALSWEEVGVPLALIGFDDKGHVAFVDRHAVARRGGKARSRTALLPGAGSPALWQARVEQLGEQILDALGSTGGEDVGAGFAFAPPAGVLPLALVDDLDKPGRAERFFPPRFAIEWAPIPLDQLDLALAESAPLARLDFERAERVRMLVPVPPSVFEPRLLAGEHIGEEFQEAVDELRAKLIVARRVRDQVRAMRAEIAKAIDGKGAAPVYPDEPDRVPAEVGPLGEEIQVPPLEPPLPVQEKLQELKQAIHNTASSNRSTLDPVEYGVRAVLDRLGRLAARANDTIDFGFLRVQADIYRVRQLVLGADKASRLATSPTLAALVQGSTAYATAKDLEEFFTRTRAPAPEPSTSETPSAATPGGGAGEATTTPRRSSPLTASSQGTSLSPLRVTLQPTSLRLDPGPQPDPRSLRARELTEKNADRLRDEITKPLPYAAPERVVTVAERLAVPQPVEAYNSAVNIKHESLRTLQDLSDQGFSLSGIEVVVPDSRAKSGLANKKLGTDLTVGQAIEAAKREPSGSDESAMFSSSVRSLDETISILRQVEVRVLDYHRLADMARALLAALEKARDELDTRLAGADRALAEARHDFAVGTALLAEEQDRIRGVMERRRAVLREHVRFVAFVRPRSQRARDDLASRDLEAPEEAPLPACLHEDIVTIPHEIRVAVDLVRRAPLGWFTPWQHLLDALTDRGTLLHVVEKAVQVAALKPLALAPPPPPAAPPLAQGLHAGLSAIAQQIELRAERARAVDLVQATRLAWKDLRLEALKVVSLSDLADIGHLRPDILGGVSTVLDAVTRIAACLYRRFAQVRPELRLEWVQQVSVHDVAIGLRDLGVLRRFHEVGAEDREALQALVDWLFSQVPGAPQPQAMMHNLVRVCLLLASHAPVRQLLRGKVRPGPISIGHVLRVSEIDAAKVRIGMHVLLEGGGEHLGRAIVEDIAEGEAVARVVATRAPSVTVLSTTTALVADAEHLPAVAAQVSQALAR